MSVEPADTKTQLGGAESETRGGRERDSRRLGVIVGLAGVLVVVVLVAAGSGQVGVPPLEVLGSVLHRLGVDLGPVPSHPQGENALWAVRFPRVVLAVLVGACLGVAGAL